ncbi:MAG: DUF488 domain-containing protein [Gammaproteobacteria bacterium]|nr:MAG: DUF488 domain-containing protein [Gammaproteobacteria bacterium]
MRERIWTVGHSNRSSEALIELLREPDIELLVDVRARPHSARHPHFDEAVLRETLSEAGITYHWAGRHLGGFRQARPDTPHVALPEGFRGYADHMETEVFRRAIAQLRNLARQGRTVLMCAEREPLECHRSLIADYLLLEGVEVLHLIAPGEVREHQLRVEARRESASLVYDRHLQGALF